MFGAGNRLGIMLYHIVTYGEQAYMVPDVWWRQIVQLQNMPFEVVNGMFQQVECTDMPAGVDIREAGEVVEDFLRDIGISWQS